VSRRSTAAGSPFAPARLKTTTTLFVCAKCPGGKDRRRDVRAALKEADHARDIRTVACGCLDICPKRGAAIVLVATGRPAVCAVVDGATRTADVVRELVSPGE